MKVRKDRKGQQGFTLIELLVVVAIVSLLAVVAVPRLINATDSSKSARAKSDIVTITGALDRHYFEMGYYPQDLTDLVTRGYMKSNEFKNAWGKFYFYAVSATTNASTYALADPGKSPKPAVSNVCNLVKADVDGGLDTSVCEGKALGTTPWLTGPASPTVTTNTPGFPNTTTGSLSGFSKNIVTE